jgi:hypothetical protein
MLKNPQKRALSKVWARAYTDRRRFEQPRIGIKQAEIDQLLTVGVEDEMRDNVILYENLAKGVAIIPVDPSKVLCMSNVAVVATSTRKLLLKQWKRLGKEAYSKLIRKEQSYLSMHPMDNHSGSQGDYDDNFDGDQEIDCDI